MERRNYFEERNRPVYYGAGYGAGIFGIISEMMNISRVLLANETFW